MIIGSHWPLTRNVISQPSLVSDSFSLSSCWSHGIRVSQVRTESTGFLGMVWISLIVSKRTHWISLFEVEEVASASWGFLKSQLGDQYHALSLLLLVASFCMSVSSTWINRANILPPCHSPPSPSAASSPWTSSSSTPLFSASSPYVTLGFLNNHKKQANEPCTHYVILVSFDSTICNHVWD